MKAWIWILVGAGALAACSKGGGGGTGKERGPCYGNHTCDQGLVCLSELCVRPPGADCAKVGEKLASYRLGNYAPRDERDKAVAELTASCQQAQLTQDEGKCILDATSRYEVASCPRPLLPELAGDQAGCKGAGETVTRILLAEMAQGSPPSAQVEQLGAQLTAAMADSCVSDAWPEPVTRCVATATSTKDLDRCEDLFPAGLKDRIEQRIRPVVEKLMDAQSGSLTPPPPPVPPTPTPTPLPPPPAIDAGPPDPTPSPTGVTMMDACKAYVDLVERYTACTQVPQAARDAARQGLDAMKKSFAQAPTATPDQVAAAKQACDLAAAALTDSMKSVACP